MNLSATRPLWNQARATPDIYCAPEGAWTTEMTAALDQQSASDDLGHGVARLMVAVFAISLTAGLAVGMLVV